MARSPERTEAELRFVESESSYVLLSKNKSFFQYTGPIFVGPTFSVLRGGLSLTSLSTFPVLTECSRVREGMAVDQNSTPAFEAAVAYSVVENAA
jgi:hypothetical protein